MRNVQSIVSVMCAMLAVNPMMAQPPAAAPPPGMSPTNTAAQNTRELQVANTGTTSSPGGPLYYGLYPRREGGFFARSSSRFRYNEITPVNFTNTGRLDNLIRAGRLYLSLKDAIALALENNLDIQLSRYGAQIAQADLLRAQAGGLLRVCRRRSVKVHRAH
jgi:hypothetical protein